MRCPKCDSADYAEVGFRNGLHVWRCKACGAGFVARRRWWSTRTYAVSDTLQLEVDVINSVGGVENHLAIERQAMAEAMPGVPADAVLAEDRAASGGWLPPAGSGDART